MERVFISLPPMAFPPLLRKCKWKTRIFIFPFPYSQSSTICSSQVRRDEEHTVNNNIEIIVKSVTNESFADMESVWKTFFATPYKWCDCRMNKRSEKAPDFKHIETGKVLWIGSHKTPDWVKSKITSLGREAFSVSLSVEELWKSFFSNPSKWFDHRKVKKSDKHPDFVHRNTREGLWIKDTRNPNWVLPMLESRSDLTFAPSSSAEYLWKNLLTDPSKWFDQRKSKKTERYPDFVHKDTREVLWVHDKRNQAWVTPMLNKLHDDSFAPSSSIDNMWRCFFADPSKWIDYRKNKKNKKFPDFRHKENGEALWIENMKTPAWVLPKLNDLQDEMLAPCLPVKDLWLSLLTDQSNWIDYRKNKKSNNHPDFVHKDTSEALWIETVGTPSWVISKLNNLQSEVFAPSPSMEEAWIAFFSNPSKWLDYGKMKRNSKFPDFKHKESGQALWIVNKNTPAWVLSKLNELQGDVLASVSVEDLWISIFLDPSKWRDYRKNKKSKAHPDFVHKETIEALWIEAIDTPAWVTLMLNNLKNDTFASVSVEDLWMDLFTDPSEWFDNRSTMKSNKYPDFKHKSSQEPLWIDDRRTPPWVLSKLKDLRHEAFACKDEMLTSHEFKWKTFFANPSNWFDNRTSKITPNTPDFRHKETKDGLWIASNWTPDWVVPSLKRLENGSFASCVVRDSE